MIPVRHAGNDLRFEFGDQRVVRFAFGSRSGGEARLDVAGLHAREDFVTIDTVEVVGDPIDEAMSGRAEFIAARVELRHRAILCRQLFSQASTRRHT